MVEGFKLTAKKLKRYLKISTHLPKDYYETNKEYPMLLVFDGDLFFSFLTEDDKKINLAKKLDEINSKFITIGLFSPKIPEWRISELNPYYNGDKSDVDTTLSINYYDYIINELLPILKVKYRLNNEIYLFGLNEGAIASIYMLYHYDINGAILFNPVLEECNDKLYEDINNSFDKSKRLYLYKGGKDISDTELNNFYKFEEFIENKNPLYFMVDYDKNRDNSYDSIDKHINSSLELVKAKI